MSVISLRSILQPPPEDGADEGMLGSMGAKALLLAVLTGLFGGGIPADVGQVSGNPKKATTHIVRSGQKYEITIKSV